MQSTGRKSETGFTLVELLMVMFILGLSSSLVIMSLPERPSGLHEDARVLRSDIKTLGDKAVLAGTPHAIELTRTGYHGSVWRGGNWAEIAGSDRAFSQGVTLSARLGKADVSRIVLDPAGMPGLTALELSLGGDIVQIALSGSDLRARP